MTDSLKTVNPRKPVDVTKVPQTEKAAKGQKKNNAGGFSFVISDTDRIKRFLILGAEGNQYRSGAQLAKENAKVIIKAASTSDATSKKLVDLIVEVSTQGRAAKQDAGIFALAIAASYGSTAAKAYALSKLPAVLRTGTTLFQFAGYVEQFRGWGPALRRAVSEWYTSKNVDKLAYQTAKYQSRNGYTHRDLFRLSHPVSKDPAFQGLGEWILRKDASNVPDIVRGLTEVHKPGADVPALIRQYGLSWEMVPTQSLNEVATWEALLDGNVPLGALLRQLPRLTQLGIFTNPAHVALRTGILARLTDKAEIERARIHPIAVLTALKTYTLGRSIKGSSSWSPVGSVSAALDKMFYLAFKNVTPANKRTLIGLDISGSMGSRINDSSPLTSREVTAAIAMVTRATEPFTHVVGFTGVQRYYFGGRNREVPNAAGPGKYGSLVTNLDNEVDPSRRLDDVVSGVSRLPMGDTDCALPMLYAMEAGLEIDTFVILTDNETWSGAVHPHVALQQYRDKMGIPAKLVVLSTEPTQFSIADPNDVGMLDVAGFDSAVPGLLSDFSRGL